MSILDNITKIFSKNNSQKFLGVDIGSSSIKVVQLSFRKGIAVLDTFGEISLSVYAGKEVGQSVSLEDSKIVEALKDLMKEAQVDAVDAGLSIPLKSTLMFNLKLPTTIKKENMAEIVMMESRKYIPVQINEVKLDWSIIPDFSQKKQEYYNVLVVAIHKETLNKYINYAKSAGLNLKFLEVETFSTIRSVIKYENNVTTIVDIGSSVTKVFITERGIIRRSNIINVGVSKVLKQYRNNNDVKVSGGEVNGRAIKLLREEIQQNKTKIPLDLTRIIGEVKKSIIAFQRMNQKNVTDVVFTGGGALVKDIMDYVSKELSSKIIIADPFSKVSNPAYLDDPLKEAGPEFAVAVGLSLRGLKN